MAWLEWEQARNRGIGIIPVLAVAAVAAGAGGGYHVFDKSKKKKKKKKKLARIAAERARREQEHKAWLEQKQASMYAAGVSRVNAETDSLKRSIEDIASWVARSASHSKRLSMALNIQDEHSEVLDAIEEAAYELESRAKSIRTSKNAEEANESLAAAASVYQSLERLAAEAQDEQAEIKQRIP